jgi:hypothetical protein
MRRTYLIFAFAIFQFLLIGCKSSTEPPINKDGRISGKITIGEYDRKPKSILWIKLNKESNNSFQLIDSVFTNNARYTFENLLDGIYSICFTQDQNYTPFRNWQPNDATCQIYEVKSSSKNDSLDFHLFAWHHFTQDSIVIEVDTTNWNSASVSSKFYNDGVRDTIVWHINPSSKPDWLGVTPTSGSYEPEVQSDKWISVTIHKHDFPVTMWNHTVQLEIFSQFAVHILAVVFKVV